MKKNLAKLLALILVVAMVATLFAGCAKKEEKTLVVATADFSSKFTPFFYTAAYDGYIAVDMTQVGLLSLDREGNVVLKGIEGTKTAYNGTDYTYYGIADCDITINDDGSVDYKITMRKDIKFSDGKKATIDDALFSIYVLCDPTYDGSSTFYALPVEGMEEYRSGMDSVANVILAAGPDAVSELSNADQTAAYWTAFNAAGEKFAQEIVDYCIASGYGTDVTTAAAAWGYELAEGATAADFFAQIVATYGYDLSDAGINYETAGTSISEYINTELGDKAAEYAIGVKTGDSAANISGITRIDDYTMNVHMTEYDATAIYNMGVTLAPLHYYGDTAKFNYDNNEFGFTKGDLSIVKEKSTVPLGAGPYKFVSYENGTVTLEANKYFFQGEPKTKYILFKETSSADMLTGISTGTYDLTADASYGSEQAESIKGYNSNGEVTGDVYTTISIDNLGYGYLGMNAENVKVGTDAGSDASRSLRKAFATLFAVYRDTVIDSYYGERASVIQYPISNTSWAAPKPADEGFEIAYSKDVDGNELYTADMTEDAKYDAALQAAIGYLKAAGYTWDDATSKFTAAPEGAAMSYEVTIGADGTGDHPSFNILTNTKEALASIGLTLEINDVTDSAILFGGMESGTLEMWAAAWQVTPDPDMYQVYHSSNSIGAGGTDSNHYCIKDATLDELILEARGSADQTFRKDTYKECLNIILDWACEIPTYQRQNATLVSTARVDVATVTPDITPYYGWMAEAYNIVMK